MQVLSSFGKQLDCLVRGRFPGDFNCFQVLYDEFRGKQVPDFFFRREVECCSCRGRTIFTAAAKLGVLFGKADRKIACSRVEEPAEVPDIGRTVFGIDRMQ